GVNLRAAIASLETMLEYGFMEALDKDLRANALREAQRKKVALADGERQVEEWYGSQWYGRGIVRSWRSGRLILTNRRLILYRPMPPAILWQTPLAKLRGCLLLERSVFSGAPRPLLALEVEGEPIALLTTEDTAQLLDALRLTMAGEKRALPEASPDLSEVQRLAFTIAGTVLAEGPMERQGADGKWGRGHLYLTSSRLMWWGKKGAGEELDIPLRQIEGVRLAFSATPVEVGAEPENLFLLYREDGSRRKVNFRPELGSIAGCVPAITGESGSLTTDSSASSSGEVLAAWRRRIKELVLDQVESDDHPDR
ncbi:MAG: hypothetical protein WCO14_05080, partial [bacterium]